jgi:MtN3 and saliva related transmembrane protein
MILIKNVIEIGFSAALFVNAALFLPQIIRLLKVKDGKGLSLLTFGGFNLIQIFVILHGFIVKDYLLVTGYLLSLITCGFITLLIIFYRLKN